MNKTELVQSMRSLGLIAVSAAFLATPALRALATNGEIDASIVNATCMILGVAGMSLGLADLKR
ncbi:hypothetical protein HFN89_00490 [Rhizobium laguerreae]|nr:hypothetical protein [Rhizobium laguerreae]